MLNAPILDAGLLDEDQRSSARLEAEAWQGTSSDDRS